MRQCSGFCWAMFWLLLYTPEPILGVRSLGYSFLAQQVGAMGSHMGHAALVPGRLLNNIFNCLLTLSSRGYKEMVCSMCINGRPQTRPTTL